MIVYHNMKADNAHRMLGINQSGIAKNVEKLSSGLRVNRAADDAAGLYISEKMRSQVRGLTQASRNAQDGISAVQTAEGALDEVHAMLQRMRELSVQAGNETMEEKDVQAIQDEINQLVQEIDSVSDKTEFNKQKLLNGEFDNRVLQVGANKDQNLSIQIDSMSAQSLGLATGDVASKVPSEGKAKNIKSAKDAADELTDVNKEIARLIKEIDETDKSASVGNVKGSAVVASHKYDVTKGLIASVDKLKASVTALTGSAKSLKLTYDILTASYNNVKNDPTKAVTAKTAMQKAEKKLAAKQEELKGKTDTLNKKSKTVETKMKRVEELYTQGKQLAKNVKDLKAYEAEVTVIKGGNHSKEVEDIMIKALLKSDDLSVAAGAKLAQGATGGKGDLSAVDIVVGEGTALNVTGASNDKAGEALDKVDKAINAVSKQRSRLGAIQNRLEHTIRNLNNAAENTQAAESRIRHVDMAKEMSTFTRNNILTQASQAMLAQANQLPQQVLQLLR